MLGHFLQSGLDQVILVGDEPGAGFCCEGIDAGGHVGCLLLELLHLSFEHYHTVTDVDQVVVTERPVFLVHQILHDGIAPACPVAEFVEHRGQVELRLVGANGRRVGRPRSAAGAYQPNERDGRRCHQGCP
jgi:hypothetical protein